MNIISNLKNLIFGAKAAPVEQVPIRAVPHPEQSSALRGKEIESPERNGQDRQRLGASDEQSMLIQSCFRVVNESIEMARKSKNLETKMSRLGVARNSLKQARTQADQFSLKVDGFDAAEAEINRLDEAIRVGTPTEIAGMQQIDVNAAFSSAARNLLKDATALKRENKFIEACEKLREAYSADGAENLMIEDRLRLPMYLQLAGKNDEGWDELNSLSVRYIDQFSQSRIAHQMAIFLRKENNETASNPVRVILRSDNKDQGVVSESTSITVGELQNAPQPVRKTVGDMQSAPMSAWGNDDIIRGLEFSAAMQLRTPLRVLLRHGELHTDVNKAPPQIAQEMWEGIWILKTKTFREMGLDIDEFPKGGASDVGTVRSEDYLPFLIAVREIVEADDSVEDRIGRLRQKLMDENWKIHVEKHEGIEGVISYFFPLFVFTIPRIGEAIASELIKSGLVTPNSIAAASDETLRSIKGLGPAKLTTIRGYCAGIAHNRDADRVENVKR